MVPTETTLNEWAVNEAAPLVLFPSAGACECGSEDWQDVEHGYVRSSRASFETPMHDHDGDVPVLVIHNDGWDDMSEDGDGERYIQCGACGKRYEVPPKVSYE